MCLHSIKTWTVRHCNCHLQCAFLPQLQNQVCAWLFKHMWPSQTFSISRWHVCTMLRNLFYTTCYVINCTYEHIVMMYQVSILRLGCKGSFSIKPFVYSAGHDIVFCGNNEPVSKEPCMFMLIFRTPDNSCLLYTSRRLKASSFGKLPSFTQVGKRLLEPVWTNDW